MSATKIIKCLACGKTWPWIDGHSFRACECGNLYVIGLMDSNDDNGDSDYIEEYTKLPEECVSRMVKK